MTEDWTSGMGISIDTYPRVHKIRKCYLIYWILFSNWTWWSHAHKKENSYFLGEREKWRKNAIGIIEVKQKKISNMANNNLLGIPYSIAVQLAVIC